MNMWTKLDCFICNTK